MTLEYKKSRNGGCVVFSCRSERHEHILKVFLTQYENEHKANIKNTPLQLPSRLLLSSLISASAQISYTTRYGSIPTVPAATSLPADTQTRSRLEPHFNGTRHALPSLALGRDRADPERYEAAAAAGCVSADHVKK